VAVKIVARITSVGGRFLKQKHKTASGEWYELIPQEAKAKVSHAIRDAIAARDRNQQQKSKGEMLFSGSAMKPQHKKDPPGAGSAGLGTWGNNSMVQMQPGGSATSSADTSTHSVSTRRNSLPLALSSASPVVAPSSYPFSLQQSMAAQSQGAQPMAMAAPPSMFHHTMLGAGLHSLQQHQPSYHPFQIGTNTNMSAVQNQIQHLQVHDVSGRMMGMGMGMGANPQYTATTTTNTSAMDPPGQRRTSLAMSMSGGGNASTAGLQQQQQHSFQGTLLHHASLSLPGGGNPYHTTASNTHPQAPTNTTTNTTTSAVLRQAGVQASRSAEETKQNHANDDTTAGGDGGGGEDGDHDFLNMIDSVLGPVHSRQNSNNHPHQHWNNNDANNGHHDP